MGDVPFGIIGWIENELRNGRIKIRAKLAGLAVEASVAACAVHHVKLHTVDQVRICGRDWVAVMWGMPLHGGIHGLVGNPSLRAPGGTVGIGIDEAEQRDR